MILASLLACGASYQIGEDPDAWSPDAYWSAREVCGLEEGDYIPLARPDPREPMDVSPACEAHLAEAIGLDLDDPETQEDALDVVSGLYTILASDQGEVSRLLQDDVPALLREKAASLETGSGLPAGSFWYWLVEWEVDTIQFKSNSGVGFMSYNARDKTISVFQKVEDFPMFTFDGELFAPPLDVVIASSLVHESSHAFVPHHACEGHCDKDMGGAYGVEAWWDSRWIAASGTSVGAEDCRDAIGALYHTCMFVLEPDFPCEDVEELSTKKCGT